MTQGGKEDNPGSMKSQQALSTGTSLPWGLWETRGLSHPGRGAQVPIYQSHPLWVESGTQGCRPPVPWAARSREPHSCSVRAQLVCLRRRALTGLQVASADDCQALPPPFKKLRN